MILYWESSRKRAIQHYVNVVNSRRQITSTQDGPPPPCIGDSTHLKLKYEEAVSKSERGNEQGRKKNALNGWQRRTYKYYSPPSHVRLEIRDECRKNESYQGDLEKDQNEIINI